MPLDAYAPCPCGSGKKFKWCCQPIHVEMDKAFRQEADGQHDAALRIMDTIIAEHPANPEALGRKAELLYQNGRMDEAESTLQKALDINPQYPFGHLLRGLFRQHEGETAGALLLFRKAADLYDPEAHSLLALVYSRIAECEFKMNRPLAARAALKLALHYQPANEEMRQGFDDLFGDKSRLPRAARIEYTFQSPSAGISGSRREAWDRVVGAAATTRLSEAGRVFEQLTADDSDDRAAWYNLGLIRAWLGDNHAGLDALERYVALEDDDARAVSAATLGEVLRCAHGMEDQANWIEHGVIFQIRSPQQLFAFLQQWEAQHRLAGVQINQEQGVVTGVVLDRVTTLTAESTAAPGLGAYLLVVADLVRLWNTDIQALDRIRQELKQGVGPALSDARMEQAPANFHDVLSEALTFPVNIADKEEGKRRVEEHMQHYFEEKWIHRPLRSLGMVSPVDAVSQPMLRRKLLGVVDFMQQCAVSGQGQFYDFDRLRRQLGLLGSSKTAAGAATPDIQAMGASELAALRTEDLLDDSLEQAYQLALKLDARDLAGRFAQALVARPPRADRPDRFPWYSHLVQMALASGDTDSALNYVNEGEKADCELNEGRRRNEYELRRAQVHARRGEPGEAQGIFERLIERAPSELRYRGSAAEAMLATRQGKQALHFAEQGLSKAREKNDRDSEQYFQELVTAARKETTP